jgi:hypothetical protein
MAMEEPYTGVIGLEAYNHVSVRSDEDGITTHRDFRERAIVGIGTLLVWGAVDGLEVVSVQMERMLSRIEIVEDYINDLILFQDKRI